MVKKCLKSWIFWLLMSVVIICVEIYYNKTMDNYYMNNRIHSNCIHDYSGYDYNCIYDYSGYDYYDGEYFGGLILSLFILSNIMCLVNLSRKDGIRRLLTVTICSFVVFLFLNMGYEEDLFDYDILEDISMLSFFFVFIPAGTLTLLKLVWRNKNNDESGNDGEKKNVIEEKKVEEVNLESVKLEEKIEK